MHGLTTLKSTEQRSHWEGGGAIDSHMVICKAIHYGQEAASLDNQFLTFRMNIVVAFPRVEILTKEGSWFLSGQYFPPLEMRTNLTVYEPCIVIYLCNKNQQMHTFYINSLIQLQCLRHVSNIQVFILRKTCTCSFYGFSFTHPYKQTVQWHDVLDTSCHRPDCLYGCMKEIPQNCMYKSSLGLKLECSKHVEDTIVELKH